MFEGKNVLVAGGSGFVGTNLTVRLLEMGAIVTATIHKRQPQFKDERVNYIQADLTNPIDCQKAVKNQQFVFMCAANTSGAAVIENSPLAHVTPNVIMNTNMLDAAYSAGALKYLFISSNTVYPPYEHPVKEDEAFAGDLYEKYYCVGWMKRFSEILCGMYSEQIKKPMKTVVVRPGNIYGEWDDFEWETSHVLPALIRKVVERHDPVEVWGDGNDRKDFIYIKDFIDGMLMAMEKLETFQPVNIAKGESISVREALDIIVKADSYINPTIKYNSDKPSMIPLRLIDTTLAESLFGFRAATSFEEGIRNTIAWYRNTIA